MLSTAHGARIQRPGDAAAILAAHHARAFAASAGLRAEIAAVLEARAVARRAQEIARAIAEHRGTTLISTMTDAVARARGAVRVSPIAPPPSGGSFPPPR